ncbi:MAG: hypothetical protein ACOYXT_08260 [Bacteroidota bacterium]
MRIIVILTTILLMSSCSNQNENIKVTNGSLSKELDSFIDYIAEDTFRLEKAVTVFVPLNDEHYHLALKNKIPESCDKLRGYYIHKSGFIIYFVADKEYPRLFNQSGKYQCTLADKRTTIPMGTHCRDRFYNLKGDSLQLEMISVEDTDK